MVLTSADRQHWTVQGPLTFSGTRKGITPESRPYAPRIAVMTDRDSGERRDVLFITYPSTAEAPDDSGQIPETTGYMVGNLDGTTLHHHRVHRAGPRARLHRPASSTVNDR